jgi:hypothetical protein
MMARREKISDNSGSQIGSKVIPEPTDEWSVEFLEALGSWAEEIERPEARSIASEEDPFT